MLLSITGGRMVAASLTTGAILWDQSAGFTGAPVTGNGAVYAMSGTVVGARALADGSLLWSWSPPAPYTGCTSLALSNNLLFASCSGGATGMTFAIDIASRRSVWSHPVGGELSLSGQGFLYIVRGEKVVAVGLR